MQMHLLTHLSVLTLEVEGLTGARAALALVFYGSESNRIRLAVNARLSEAVKELEDTLLAYEKTGDHDHSVSGKHPIRVGGSCPGGDCWVSRARKALAAYA